MRYLISFGFGFGFALAAGLWLATGWGSGRSPHAFADRAAVERWMTGYYLQPGPQRLVQAIETLSAAGALADEAQRKPAAAFFAALIAHDHGTLELLTQALAEAAPAKRQLLVEAVALSGLPEWRRLLTVLKRLVPARTLHIETLLAEPEAQPTLSLPFDTAGVVLDVVAHFTATGSEAAARRIVAGLAGAAADTDPGRLQHARVSRPNWPWPSTPARIPGCLIGGVARRRDNPRCWQSCWAMSPAPKPGLPRGRRDAALGQARVWQPRPQAWPIMGPMRSDLFDFELPADRIALQPVSPRDAARLLLVRPGAAPFADSVVRKLPEFLLPGDALVLNDTRVIRAALLGERWLGEQRATIAFNLHKRLDESRWLAFARPSKRLQGGDRIRFGHDGRVCLLGQLDATVVALGEAGEVELSFSLHGPYLDEAIEALGDPPLPPYIASRRPPVAADAERYQTIYARQAGAVAAPTAGLHFTPELLAALEARGVSRHFVTLHVGAGTFLPVKAEDTAQHRMHAEWGEISNDSASALNGVRRAGGRILAVGSTALRLLETAAGEDGSLRPFAGETQLFITPGYRFKAVDLLLTNFHLPRSTLFMLAAAFCGLETMQQAYAHALAAGYRFYSYGDACLLYGARASR